jgi:DNA-binding protein HU-beta
MGVSVLPAPWYLPNEKRRNEKRRNEKRRSEFGMIAGQPPAPARRRRHQRGSDPAGDGRWPEVRWRGHHQPVQSEAILGDLVTLATRHFNSGDKIRLTGVGILQVRRWAAKMGPNPATGEAIKIEASKKIAFRPAKELKEAV